MSVHQSNEETSDPLGQASTLPVSEGGPQATWIDNSDLAVTSINLSPGGRFLDFRIVSNLKVTSGEADLWLVEPENGGPQRVLKLYRYGIRPKLEILERLSRLQTSHVVEVLDYGRVEGRYYEIQEYLSQGSLGHFLSRFRGDITRIREVIRQIAEALTHVQEFSVLHRDIKPSNILVRCLDPLDLVLTDFGISSVSDVSTHLTNLSRTPAYCAPEAVAGVVTRASDWWSLGVIILELIKGRHPFANLSQQTINRALVRRGIAVPDDLPEEWQLLLRGMLTRDYSKRWRGAEVFRWLEGDRDIPVSMELDPDTELPAHKPYRFAGEEYVWAHELAKALMANWNEAMVHWNRGHILRWVELELIDQELASRLFEIERDTALGADLKLSAAILAMHPDLPLTVHGSAIDRSACESRPELASSLLNSSLGNWLARLRQEDWLQAWTSEYHDAKVELENCPVAFDCDRVPALLCAPMPWLREQADTRRSRFAGARDHRLDALFAKEPLSRSEAILLFTADESLFFTDQEAELERRLLDVRNHGWRVDAPFARRLIEQSDRQHLLSLWQRARSHWEGRQRTPLEATHPRIPPLLQIAVPESADAIAVLVNRIDFENSLGMRFVPMPGTRKLVSIWQTRSADYEKYIRARGIMRTSPPFNQDRDHPVVLVNWKEAMDFCEWLTESERAAKRIGPRDKYRLLTDIEWSQLAGLSSETGATPADRSRRDSGLYAWGSNWPPPPAAGNLGPELKVDSFPFTAPAGSFPPNEAGLHDLGSNVMEWCLDDFDERRLKTARGASWFHSNRESCLITLRHPFQADARSDTLGFRCLLEYRVPPPASMEARLTEGGNEQAVDGEDPQDFVNITDRS